MKQPQNVGKWAVHKTDAKKTRAKKSANTKKVASNTNYNNNLFIAQNAKSQPPVVLTALAALPHVRFALVFGCHHGAPAKHPTRLVANLYQWVRRCA